MGHLRVYYQQQNMVGRLVRGCWGPLYNDCDYFGYDVLGRRNRQDRWNLTLLYTFNLAGDPTRIEYYEYSAGKSRLVDYTYNPAGRATQVREANGAGTVYADGILYHPHGAWKSMTLHNGTLRRTTEYNNRLQPSVLAAEDLSPLSTIFSLSYGFNHGTANNGNVAAITDAIQNLAYNYNYDELNRLAGAWTSGPEWGNTYVYDIWGNLTNMNPIPGKTYYQNLQAAPASTKNQLPSFSYDAAGNMTADGVHTYAWDAENRMQSLDAGAATYAYTPDGERVKKTVSGTATLFISGGGGVLEEVTNGTGGPHLPSDSS